jgi:hypothetical protein
VTWRRETLSAFLGHRIVYRNLAPADPALDGLDAIWPATGLPRYQIPRKTSIEYARAVWQIVQQAQRLRGQPTPVARVLLVGDSARNDGAVARNMGLDAPSRAFIGLDDPAHPRQVQVENGMMVANRWDALADLLAWLARDGFYCDERTAVMVDLDKTIIGARGRNDGVLDLARVRAAERTAAGALGARYDEGTFRSLYARLNRSDCHWVTEDNQDYVAYMSLMVAAGAVPAEAFWAAMGAHAIEGIAGFSAWCDGSAAGMGPRLLAAHREVRAGILGDDPTPFKSFRRDEFAETIALMDVLGSDAAEDAVLANEIVITGEVESLCRHLAARGALVFGLSDKPDEASMPDRLALAGGALAIHDTPMKVYGPGLF